MRCSNPNLSGQQTISIAYHLFCTSTNDIAIAQRYDVVDITVIDQ